MPVSVRFTEAPSAVEGGDSVPLGFRISSRRGGLLTCEASLWCSLVTPTGGFRWPPEARLSAEVVKVALDPEPVAPGDHDRSVELVVPDDARPTVTTSVGKVRYELNVVAIVDDRRGVANREVVVRSTAADPGIDTAVDGDAPWDLGIELAPAHVGQALEGTIRITPDAPAVVTVAALLEEYEESARHGQQRRWSAERELATDLALEPGVARDVPLRFELPGDVPPTVLMRTFVERWVLSVTVSDGARTRRLATGVAVLS